jgi:hypothetical protein
VSGAKEELPAEAGHGHHLPVSAQREQKGVEVVDELLVLQVGRGRTSLYLLRSSVRCVTNMGRLCESAAADSTDDWPRIDGHVSAPDEGRFSHVGTGIVAPQCAHERTGGQGGVVALVLELPEEDTGQQGARPQSHLANGRSRLAVQLCSAVVRVPTRGTALQWHFARRQWGSWVRHHRHFLPSCGIHASSTEQNANEWAISTPESEEGGNCIGTQEVSSQSKCWHTDFCHQRLSIFQDTRLHRTQVKEVRQQSRAIAPSDAQTVPSTRYTGDAFSETLAQTTNS